MVLTPLTIGPKVLANQ